MRTATAGMAAGALAAGCLFGDTRNAGAQTDFYNTDAGRPVLIEDAYPVERYAFELQLAPLRVERERGGVYGWGVEPEVAYGILPMTQIEIGFPVVFVDAGSSSRAGLAGVELSVMHNLNTETRTLPAFAVVVHVHGPAGAFGPRRAYVSVKGIATRSFRLLRTHANVEYTFGSARLVRHPDEALGVRHEVSRLVAGVAVDKTLPLRSMLLIADLYVRDPAAAEDRPEWHASAGVRYQFGPRFALDGGIGHRFTGADRVWFATFGAAYAFAIRSFIPVPRSARRPAPAGAGGRGAVQ